MEQEIPPGQEALNGGVSPRHYVLRLYISGAASRSGRAVASLHQLCETHLKNQYELDVVDVYQNPSVAKLDRIVAVPTLIRLHPTPIRRLTGNLTDRQRVLSGLGIIPKAEPTE